MYPSKNDPDYCVKKRLLYEGAGKKYSNPNAAEQRKRYIERFPEVYKAVRAVYVRYVPKGINRHHWSYNDEHLTDIIIVPSKLHMRIHRFLFYDQSVKMFRTKEGELLDTKQKHLDFINIMAEERIMPLLPEDVLEEVRQIKSDLDI